MIIDFHTHIYPDEVEEKVLSRLEDFYGVKRRHPATVNGLLSSMEKGGVDYAVVLPVPTKREHLKYNEWYASLPKINSKIIPLGGVFSGLDAEMIEEFKKVGLKGFKFQPNACRCFPDDQSLFPLYERAQELGMIVVFHIGDEEGGIKGEYSSPERYVKVLKKFPRLKVVLSHLGGYMRWDGLDNLLPFENAFFDTSYVPRSVEEEKFKKLVSKIGLERIVFGTDFPFRDHQEERDYIERVLGEKAIIKMGEVAGKLLFK
jgi:hypothetical protein